MLVFDAGNALFANPGTSNEVLKGRASFVMSVMGALGTKVMAAGHRDLSAGAAFLREEAAKAQVTVLSANLREKGEPVFVGSQIVLAGTVKVAFVGVTAAGPVPGFADLTGEPVVEAARREVAKLAGHKRDLTVLLVASSYQEAQTLAAGLKGQVDLVVVSGEFRGMVAPQNFDGTFVLGSGQKGQSIAKVELMLGGSGPLIDLGEAERAKEQASFVASQIKALDERMKLATGEPGKADLTRMIAEMKARQAGYEKVVKAPATKGARWLKNEWVELSSAMKDDEQLKAQVLKIDPAYSGSH